MLSDKISGWEGFEEEENIFDLMNSHLIVKEKPPSRVRRKN